MNTPPPVTIARIAADRAFARSSECRRSVRSPPPRDDACVAALSVIAQSGIVKFSMFAIAPPELFTSPPVSVRPLIVMFAKPGALM